MQFTGAQRTLILKGVMLYVLTEVGGADGAGEIDTTKCPPSYTVTNPLPTSPVIAVTVLLPILLVTLVAATLMPTYYLPPDWLLCS